ncbi:hypothetical protein FKM82_025906 [Ascaphus truei]
MIQGSESSLLEFESIFHVIKAQAIIEEKELPSNKENCETESKETNIKNRVSKDITPSPSTSYPPPSTITDSLSQLERDFTLFKEDMLSKQSQEMSTDN